MTEKSYGLGERLTHLRKSKGLSVATLAVLVNSSPSAIASWEAEKVSPSVNSLRRICQVTNVSADWLLGVGDKNTLLQDVQARLTEALCELQTLERMAEKDDC